MERSRAAASSEAFARLRDTKTFVLTTYRRDGTPVGTPVSIACDGDRAFFRTWDATWKVKRLARNPEVRVAPSTFRGAPTGREIRARARRLSGAEARTAAGALCRRHRLVQRVLVPFTHRLMRYRTVHYELVPIEECST